jgi:4-amino-4-deoxy-L-arabinose transferase-like glycosyltransferase
MTDAPRRLSRFAWSPVAVVLAIDAGLLLATVDRYGYFRDELYFRMLAAHPAWGYVDQPPFTPMLAKAGMAVFGDTLWALRLPAMLFALAAVGLTAAITRELGGGRAAQTLAATGVSSLFLLIAGHVLLTATPDQVVWLLVLLFAARALRRDDPRWWLGVGCVVGMGLYNKQLVLLLVAALAVSLLVVGPGEHLRSRWLWSAVAVATLLALPNVLYQATHGWPEATMAHALAAQKGSDDRTFFVPFQLVMLGVTITPIWVAGLVHLLRDARFRRVRALGIAYPVVAALVVITGGQPYYTFGLLAFLFAVGSVVITEWAAAHRGRWAWIGAAVTASAATAVVVGLPVIPAQSLPAAIGTINQTARDSVGWPTYVREIAIIYQAIPTAERSRTVILTDNYGEAGAVSRYGYRYHLPPAYSGQNELFTYGPPPPDTTTALVVGLANPGRHFADCRVASHLDDRLHVSNEEQGRPISICRGPDAPWPRLWDAFRHYD